MAEPKTYTEDEHLAVLADRVSKETATITAERDGLKAERDEAANKLDAAESAKVTAEQRAADAEQALTDYKAEVETEREAASRKDTRIAKMREVAGHLKDDFFVDEKRVDRVTAMSDDDFAGYVDDLAAGAPAGTPGTPRETAMTGQEPAGPTETSNTQLVLLGHRKVV